jgi:hypothetical protein
MDDEDNDDLICSTCNQAEHYADVRRHHTTERAILRL